MSKYTAATMLALGFAPRAHVVYNEPAARLAPNKNGAASWDSIAAAVRAETGAQAALAAADRIATPPPGNYGWDAVAADLIAEAGMQSAPTGEQS